MKKETADKVIVHELDDDHIAIGIRLTDGKKKIVVVTKAEAQRLYDELQRKI